jgi:hypothetical protein
MANFKTWLASSDEAGAAELARNCPGAVTLLLKDHKAMRALMSRIKSHRSSPALIERSFRGLEKLVVSHMAAEETALLRHLKAHPKFKSEALEGWEEHRIHEQIFKGIRSLQSPERKRMRMKIYCEILEHHLHEEEEDLFPAYTDYFALSTRKKAGRKFLKRRLQTNVGRKRVGALAKT